MNKESIFAGLVGLIVGGTATGFAVYGVMKRKYTDILNKTVDNYEKLLSEAEEALIEDDIPDELKRYIPGEEKKSEKEEEAPKISEEDKKVIREKLRYNNERTTNYAKMYATVGDVIDAKAEDGEPDPEEVNDIDKDDEEVEEMTNIFEATSEASSRPPVIISQEHFDEFVNENSVWDVENLFLYNDGTVTTEDDKVIDSDELDEMLGDCLDKYNFRTSSEKTIFVQCFKLTTIYEINKLNKPFIP